MKLRTVFLFFIGGSKNSHGEAIYNGWFYDSGINQEGWRGWKLSDSQTAESNARNTVLSKGSMTYYFMTQKAQKSSPVSLRFQV